MLTSFAADEALDASILAGAAGYVLKQIKGGELVRALSGCWPPVRVCLTQPSPAGPRGGDEPFALRSSGSVTA